MKATRAQVYAALNSERSFQKHLAERAGTPRGEERPHSVEEFSVYMSDYMRELQHQLSRVWTPSGAPSNVALATLRKITAMGVAAMEQHGAPLRAGFDKHDYTATENVKSEREANLEKFLQAAYNRIAELNIELLKAWSR